MTVEHLNECIHNETICELMRVAEARQVKALSRIADVICARPEIRLVLVAGGSSAGKTTTAKRLCTQLRVNDREALYLSTDDYFVGDKRNPRDENGNLDYEHVACVDAIRLTADLKALFSGEPIIERRFDFMVHEPTYTDRTLVLPKNGFVVLEGLHALNPILTEGLDPKQAYRVFVEPKPSLELVDGIYPTATDSRFLRRMVRDNQFRKMDPKTTLDLWPKVLEGEKKWIEPFRPTADVIFDSYLVYELAVLKPYVGGLLERIRREHGSIPQVEKMIVLLSTVDFQSADTVPGNSILRETIGGSQLEY